MEYMKISMKGFILGFATERLEWRLQQNKGVSLK